MDTDQEQAGLAWQLGVWNRISDIYLREIDQRFTPVVDRVVARAALTAGQHVLDLGTGTGAVAERTAQVVGPQGQVVGVELSPDMLALAQRRMAAGGLTNVRLREGRAESLPAEDAAFDVVLASLSVMYVLDRAAAAREIARVLRPQGRLVAAVWAGPEQCDIVLFQQTAGRFAGPPPVPGVGPGALADPTLFLQQLTVVCRRCLPRHTRGRLSPGRISPCWRQHGRIAPCVYRPERHCTAGAARGPDARNVQRTHGAVASPAGWAQPAGLGETLLPTGEHQPGAGFSAHVGPGGGHPRVGHPLPARDPCPPVCREPAVLVARIPARLAGPLGRSPFRFDAGGPIPVRYRFALSGAVPSTHDMLVENEKARMEPAGTATPHVTFHCETDIFVLMMYRRLTLESVIASGQLVVEGDQGLTAAFDHWLKGA